MQILYTERVCKLPTTQNAYILTFWHAKVLNQQQMIVLTKKVRHRTGNFVFPSLYNPASSGWMQLSTLSQHSYEGWTDHTYCFKISPFLNSETVAVILSNHWGWFKYFAGWKYFYRAVLQIVNFCSSERFNLILVWKLCFII